MNAIFFLLLTHIDRFGFYQNGRLQIPSLSQFSPTDVHTVWVTPSICLSLLSKKKLKTCLERGRDICHQDALNLGCHQEHLSLTKGTGK